MYRVDQTLTYNKKDRGESVSRVLSPRQQDRFPPLPPVGKEEMEGVRGQDADDVVRLLSSQYHPSNKTCTTPE